MSPGDLLACHSTGFIGAAIRLGEWLKHPRQPHFANHIAIYAGKDLDGHDVVFQATGRGTVLSDLSSLGQDYRVLPLDAFPTTDGKPADRDRVIAEAERLRGQRYGFLTIASITVSILPPRFIDFRRPGTLTCSGYAALCLHAAGVDLGGLDLYQAMPSEIEALAKEAT